MITDLLLHTFFIYCNVSRINLIVNTGKRIDRRHPCGSSYESQQYLSKEQKKIANICLRMVKFNMSNEKAAEIALRHFGFPTEQIQIITPPK